MLPACIQEYAGGEIVRKFESRMDIRTYAQVTEQSSEGRTTINAFTPRVGDIPITIAHAFTVPELEFEAMSATTTVFDHSGNVRAAT